MNVVEGLHYAQNYVWACEEQGSTEEGEKARNILADLLELLYDDEYINRDTELEE
jgi:hypothetical protein